jgi:putative SOS response-associated peptidase YedK
MPVVLDLGTEKIWLNPKTPIEVIDDLLIPFSDEKMGAFPIDPRVREIYVNGAEFLYPVGKSISLEAYN